MRPYSNVEQQLSKKLKSGIGSTQVGDGGEDGRPDPLNFGECYPHGRLVFKMNSDLSSRSQRQPFDVNRPIMECMGTLSYEDSHFRNFS